MATTGFTVYICGSDGESVGSRGPGSSHSLVLAFHPIVVKIRHVLIHLIPKLMTMVMTDVNDDQGDDCCC